MKYSVGITDSKRPSSKGLWGKRIFNPGGFAKYNMFKKINSKNVKQSRTKDTSALKLKRKKILYMFIGVVFFIGCVCLLGLGIYLKNLQKSLPSPDELVSRASDQSTQILDRNGEILYTIYGDQNREFVAIENIPEQTKWALLAAEDIDFYQHKGLDYTGIATALFKNLTSGGITAGGASTITQQLVRNTILYDVLGDEAYYQTYTRKIKEILITIQVEQTFTKDQILQMYMNEIPLGGVNYGFQAAANAYFGKDVSELDLAESALLAGIIQSPGRYSPLYGTEPDLAKDRQTYVLDQMLKHKDLTGVTQEQIDAAKAEELVYSSSKIDITAPHFVFYVKQILEEKYGTDMVERGGLKVTTSLDSSLQKMAEEEVAQGVDNARRYNVNNGAMVVLNPKNGQVLAMVGSVDYWNTEDPTVDGNVNITTSERQMGSSVKPFVYLTAITEGYGPWTEAPDLEQIIFGKYHPDDWDGKTLGTMTARKALVYSRNIPAVYTLQLAGIDPFLEVAEKAGITTLSDKANYGLSLALGSGEEKLIEHAAAYSVFASGGIKYDITPVLKVEDSSGNVLEEVKDATGKRVFDEKQIYLVNWMLCDLGGFNDRPDNGYYTIGGKKVCGKTGTTDGPKDLTTILYNQNIVIAAWNGNNNNEEMPGAWATTVTLRTANSFFKRVIETYPSETFNRPSGVLATTVCTDTGATPADGIECTKEASVYIAGSAPQTDNRKMYEVCTSNNMIPSNLTAAQKYGLTSTKILLSTTLENSLQKDTFNAYLLSIENSPYVIAEPQTGTCTLPLGPDHAPIVEISTPTSGQSVERGSNLVISGSTRVLESATSFTVKFDGNTISGASLNADGTYSVTYSVPSGTSLGNHTVSVTIVDNYGKTGSGSVVVNVKEIGSSITVGISSPTSGSSVTLPVNIIATVEGGTVDEVDFRVSKVGTSWSKEGSDTSSDGGWVYSWTDSNGSGQYSITVSAKKSGVTILGSSITVTL